MTSKSRQSVFGRIAVLLLCLGAAVTTVVIISGALASAAVNDDPRGIIFIGDSLTSGTNASTTPGATAASQLGSTNYVNYGIGQATSCDIGANSGRLGEINSYISSRGITTASVMLGTNDALRNIPWQNYSSCIQNLISHLKSFGIKVIVLHDAPYIGGQPWGNAGGNNACLRNYASINSQLVDNKAVFRGDAAFYGASSNGPGWYSDYNYIHLNNAGYQALGIYWANAIRPAVSPTGSFDSATPSGANQIRVQGWSYDRDRTALSNTVQVYIGGPAGQGEAHTVQANISNANIRSVFGINGNHGFDTTLTTSKRGIFDVYIYAVNISGTLGQSTEIGHKTVILGLPDGMVYRLASGAARIYTADKGEAAGLVTQFGFTYEGTLCKAEPTNKSRPIYRVASGSARIYTEDLGERNGLIQNFGYKSEGIGWYAAPDAAPVYRVASGAARILTASIDEAAGLVQSFGYTYERIIFGADTRNLTPVYGLDGPYQFLTAELEEMFGLIKSYGFRYSGVAFNASKTPTNTPVYRLYGPYRFYTTDLAERNGLIQNFGFSYEKIAFWASDTATSFPVHRLYGPAGRYYTLNSAVISQMRARGWSDEGVKFYTVANVSSSQDALIDSDDSSADTSSEPQLSSGPAPDQIPADTAPESAVESEGLAGIL